MIAISTILLARRNRMLLVLTLTSFCIGIVDILAKANSIQVFLRLVPVH
jgi:hypothetical protein